jgi:hypothetical protein
LILSEGNEPKTQVINEFLEPVLTAKNLL